MAEFQQAQRRQYRAAVLGETWEAEGELRRNGRKGRPNWTMIGAVRTGTLQRIGHALRVCGVHMRLFAPAQQRSRRRLTEQRQDMTECGGGPEGYVSGGNVMVPLVLRSKMCVEGA